MKARANLMMKRSSDGLKNIGDTDLDCSDPEIAEAIDAVYDASSEYTWCLLGYVPNTSRLKVVDQHDDYEELLDTLAHSSVQYVFLRHVHKRYMMLTHKRCPSGVPPIKKSLVISHGEYIGRSLLEGKYHLRIDARHEDDVELDSIKAKLKQGAGADFDSHGGIGLSGKFKQEVADSIADAGHGVAVERDDNQTIGDEEENWTADAPDREAEAATGEDAAGEYGYEEETYEEQAAEEAYEEPAAEEVYEEQAVEEAYEEPAAEEVYEEQPAEEEYEEQAAEEEYEEQAAEEYQEGEYQEGEYQEEYYEE